MPLALPVPLSLALPLALLLAQAPTWPLRRGPPSPHRHDPRFTRNALPREAFELFDEDGKGSISLRNMRHISKELGENLSDEELQASHPRPRTRLARRANAPIQSRPKGRARHA